MLLATKHEISSCLVNVQGIKTQAWRENVVASLTMRLDNILTALGNFYDSSQKLGALCKMLMLPSDEQATSTGIRDVQTQKSPELPAPGLIAQKESVFSLQFWPQATNLSRPATQFAVCDAPNAQNDRDILQQKRRSFDETRRFAKSKFRPVLLFKQYRRAREQAHC